MLILLFWSKDDMKDIAVNSYVLLEDVGKFLNSIIGPTLMLPISSTQLFGVVLHDV